MTTTPELHELAKDPRAFDTLLAKLHDKRAGLAHAIESFTSKLHNMAGDRKSYRQTRVPVWGMTDKEVTEAAQRRAAHGDHEAETVLQAIAGDRALLAAVDFEIANMTAVYNRQGNRWTRFFPSVTKSQPHIHRSLSCRTLHPTTIMRWAPELSGKTDEVAVAELDEALCSVCFPDAPVALHEYVSRRSQVEQEARQLVRDERAAVKAAKQLTEAEQFRCDGNRITTVAACVELIRHEVELADYYGRGEHPTHAEVARGARQAIAVLIDREQAHEGHGRTAEQISEIIERAIKRNVKNGAREDKIRSFPR